METRIKIILVVCVKDYNYRCSIVKSVNETRNSNSNNIFIKTSRFHSRKKKLTIQE